MDEKEMELWKEEKRRKKAVLVEKILERDKYDGRYRQLIYYDGTKQRGYISEMYFQADHLGNRQIAWRVR